MTKEEYNSLPVLFCKKCLSLRIRDVQNLEDSEYCDKCGSTDIGRCSIEEWNTAYIQRYGHCLTNNYK